MNKTQLIDVIADKADLSKAQAKAAPESTLAAITESLERRCMLFNWLGFGTFQSEPPRWSVLAATRRPVKRSKSLQLTCRHLFLQQSTERRQLSKTAWQ